MNHKGLGPTVLEIRHTCKGCAYFKEPEANFYPSECKHPLANYLLNGKLWQKAFHGSKTPEWCPCIQDKEWFAATSAGSLPHSTNRVENKTK